MSKTLMITAVSAVFLAVVSISGTPAQAAAKACKGMAMSACEADTGCSWVKSYKSKSGKSVAAHCRSKPKKATKMKAKPKNKPKTN